MDDDDRLEVAWTMRKPGNRDKILEVVAASLRDASNRVGCQAPLVTDFASSASAAYWRVRLFDEMRKGLEPT